MVVYGTTQNTKQQAFFLIMFSFGGRWSYGVVLYEIFTIGRWYIKAFSFKNKDFHPSNFLHKNLQKIKL